MITRHSRLTSRSDLIVVRYGFSAMFVIGFVVLDLIARLL